MMLTDARLPFQSGLDLGIHFKIREEAPEFVRAFRATVDSEYKRSAEKSYRNTMRFVSFRIIQRDVTEYHWHSHFLLRLDVYRPASTR